MSLSAEDLARAYFADGRVSGLPEGHFIDGDYVPGATSDRLESFDPGLARPFAAFAAGNAADVEQAVASAEKGFAIWRDTAPVERSRVLSRAAQLIRERGDYLAFIEALDSGKTRELRWPSAVPQAAKHVSQGRNYMGEII